MNTEVYVIAIFFAIASSAPVDHQDGATSYVTLSLGGHHAQTQQPYLALPQYQTSPVYIQKQNPAIVKVPTVTYKQHEEEHGPASYEFKYAVEDKHTGDIKSQHEVRDGDVVKGEYSLHEADGTVRTVKYTADKHSGFNAIVERSGNAAHPQVVPVKTVHQAPVLQQIVTNSHGLGYYH